MTAHLVTALDAPCPTVVLDGRDVPAEGEPLLRALTGVREALEAAGGGHVLKMATVAPSPHPAVDLDYRFVQALPGAPDRFDRQGSCGHSILCAVTAAARSGMTAPLAAGGRTRVRVLNNGDTVVCDVEHVEPTGPAAGAVFTAHFVLPRPIGVDAFLVDGRPRTEVPFAGRYVSGSLVSAGNPYLLLDGRDLGVLDRAELFGAGDGLLRRLVLTRSAVATTLGMLPDGAFPKVAVLVPDEGGPAVRAVSVPGWHPGLALTGAVCLATAALIPGTVAHRVAGASGTRPSPGAAVPLDLRTPGGVTRVAAAVTGRPGTEQLMWTTVGGKRVVVHGSFPLPSPAHPRTEEIARCLQTTRSAPRTAA